jgi:hypothetical protein
MCKVEPIIRDLCEIPNVWSGQQLGYQEFLFGKDQVAADFALADFLEKVAAMDAKLDIHTKLVMGNSAWEGYLARFFALPKIKEFRASDKFIETPFNSPSAKWY